MLKKCNLIYSVLKLGMETDIGTWEKLLASFFKYWIGIWLCMSSCFLYALNATEPDQMYKTSYLTYFTLDDEVFIPWVTAWLSPGDLISDLQVTANLPVDMSVFCVCNKIWSKCFLGAGGGVYTRGIYAFHFSTKHWENIVHEGLPIGCNMECSIFFITVIEFDKISGQSAITFIRKEICFHRPRFSPFPTSSALWFPQTYAWEYYLTHFFFFWMNKKKHEALQRVFWKFSNPVRAIPMNGLPSALNK